MLAKAKIKISNGKFIQADINQPWNFTDQLFDLITFSLVLEHIRDLDFIFAEAARLLGTTQAQVSALMRCRPVSVSVGKLMEFLTTLGQDVEVTVKPAARTGAGHMSVTMQPG